MKLNIKLKNNAVKYFKMKNLQVKISINNLLDSKYKSLTCYTKEYRTRLFNLKILTMQLFFKIITLIIINCTSYFALVDLLKNSSSIN